jgi:hypothetical protein
VAVPADTVERTRRLDAAAADIFRAFSAARIDALLLKGPALAALLYTRGEVRGYWDIDLLVAPRDLAGARARLAELGYKKAGDDVGILAVAGVADAESWVDAGPAATYRLCAAHAESWVDAGPGATHRWSGPKKSGWHGGELVELHLWLPGSRAPASAAWDRLAVRRTEIELCGRKVPVLNQEGLAVHLALHAAEHGSSHGRGQQELALALERWPLRIWEEAARVAAEIDAVDAFAAGLRLLPRGAELAEALGLSATDQLDWEIRHVAARPRGTFHLQALADKRGLLGRAEVLRHALLPSRDWIAREHSWARRGGATLVIGYLVHLMRAPAWAVRAWRFRRRSRRAA